MRGIRRTEVQLDRQRAGELKIREGGDRAGVCALGGGCTLLVCVTLC